jgi:PAS domain S-box-containing protein
VGISRQLDALLDGSKKVALLKEKILRESKNCLWQLIEHMGDAFFLIRPNTASIVEVNQQACDSLGYSREELLRLTLADIEQDFALNQFTERGRRLIAGETLIIERFHRRKDQTTFPVKIRVGVINLEGRCYYLVLARDVSQCKEVEKILIQARDQTESANRLKTELLANVSHELRTPLMIIQSYTQLMLDNIFGFVPSPQKQKLEVIINQAQMLNDRIDFLLDQAHLEAGKMRLQPSAFAPVELMDNTLTKMSRLAEAKDSTLTGGLSAELPPLLCGDLARLQQLLNELVSNAIKFTKAGMVEFRLYRLDPAHWGIKVTDTGPGIHPEAQAYIFEPFRQGDGSLTRKHGGTGLGLSIVQHLTELMNGQINLESEVGQGSAFTILLPLLEPTPEQPTQVVFRRAWD